MKYGKDKKNLDSQGKTAAEYYAKVERRAKVAENRVERWTKNYTKAKEIFRKIMTNPENSKEELILLLLTMIMERNELGGDSTHQYKQLLELMGFSKEDKERVEKEEERKTKTISSTAIRQLIKDSDES